MGAKESYRELLYKTYMDFSPKKKFLKNFKSSVLRTELCKNGRELGVKSSFFYTAGVLYTLADTYKGLRLLVTPKLEIKRTLCLAVTYQYLYKDKFSLPGDESNWFKESKKVAKKTMYKTIRELRYEKRLKAKEDTRRKREARRKQK